MSQRVWSSGDGDPQIPGTRNRPCSRKSPSAVSPRPRVKCFEAGASLCFCLPTVVARNEKQSLEVSISPDPATGLVEEFPFRLARRFLRMPLSLF